METQCRVYVTLDGTVKLVRDAANYTSVSTSPCQYHGYRFPPEIISYAVWLYPRFCLSFRDVEELLAFWHCEPCRSYAVTSGTIKEPPVWVRRIEQ